MKIDHKESYQDFGKQFISDNKIDGFWGSIEMLKDIVYPFKLDEISGKDIMEVGVGSGRILNNLIKFNPKKVYAIEPSNAIEVAKKNIDSNKVKFLNIKGENLELSNEIDIAFSLGVIHHIPNYIDVLKKINISLKNNGKFIFWVYGKEGNELYLFIFNNLRRITIYIPDFILRILSYFLSLITYVYSFFCKFLNLPLKNYFNEVFSKCSFQKRSYIIFDQLNPSYSKYFKKEELENVLEQSGFKILEINHRHNYSWTVICEKDKT